MFQAISVYCPKCRSAQLTQQADSARYCCDPCGTHFKAVIAYDILSSGNQSQPVPVAAPDLRPRPEIHMSDVLRLKGETAQTITAIERYGEWWKVSHGSKPDYWWLISVPMGHSRQDKENVGTLKLLRPSDPTLTVVDICVFPKEFKRSDYK